MEQSSNSYRLQRNLKEKDRRIHMKDLLSTLASVVRPLNYKLSMPELLDEATNHVKNMQARIEELKLRKALAQGHKSNSGNSSMILPVLNIRRSTIDCTILEVNLIINGLNKNFMLQEVISVLEEEGAQVVSFSSHKDGDRFIYTIISQAFSPRIGIETWRVDERLKELIGIHQHEYIDIFTKK